MRLGMCSDVCLEVGRPVVKAVDPVCLDLAVVWFRHVPGHVATQVFRLLFRYAIGHVFGHVLRLFF